MKAIVFDRYGAPDVLRCGEVEKPVPSDDEVLIKIRAASVNPLDWHFMRGMPYPLRIVTGLRRPKVRLGVDGAGEVETVGKNVTQLKAGDGVFGACRGSFAEYACALPARVVSKPRNTTFEQAAAINVAGVTALQAVRDHGRVQAGQRVLINGAAGGVGTFAVQLAKVFGAHVSGVCSTPNVAMVRSIGADRVIDYTREDFTNTGECYDVMIDCAGSQPSSACRRILTTNGRCIMVGGPTDRWFGGMGRALALTAWSRFARQPFVPMLTHWSHDDLVTLRELIEAGKVTPVIDRGYRLSELPDALGYLEAGHARGKVVITVQ